MTSVWWVLRNDVGYVAAANYVDHEGLKLKFTTDPRDALELPTKRAAHGIRRAWRFPGTDRDLVKVRRRTRTSP